MKKTVEKILKVFAKLIINKYRPLIIGITGSVGKTSAKEAVFAVLSGKRKVRSNIKNYNNEIGLPLTIIDAQAQGKSVFGWLGVFWKATSLLITTDNNYPEVLILEMGIDRPGDMDYLNGIVQSKIGIATLIGPVHLEYFGTIERIQKEKGKLIEQLPKDGYAVLNFDNEKTRKLKDISKAKVITYGFDEKADVQAKELNFSLGKAGEVQGINFKLSYKGSSVPVFLLNSLGTSAVSACLAGAAVGIIQGMNLIEIAQSLKNFRNPKGRLNLLKGIKRSLIIDDTYNSSPQSAITALGVLK